MKLEIKRDGIQIVPEGAQDEAFLEDTLGFRLGSPGVVTAVHVFSLSSAWAYLQIGKQAKQP